MLVNIHKAIMQDALIIVVLVELVAVVNYSDKEEEHHL